MPCRPMVALKQPGKPGVAQAPLPLTASKIKQTACPARSKTPRSNARPFPNVLPRRLEPGQARFRNSATSFLGTSSSQPKCAASQAKVRSEEHTSELQSRPHLVCRLLLEKKNIFVY